MAKKPLDDYSEFVRQLQTETSPRFTLKRPCFFSPALIHAILGLVTEAGELADLVKKNIGYKRPVDFTKVKDELGDVLYYLTSACTECGTDIHEIRAINMAKLSARYPGGYTNSGANMRNLAKEAKAINEVANKSEDSPPIKTDL